MILATDQGEGAGTCPFMADLKGQTVTVTTCLRFRNPGACVTISHLVVLGSVSFLLHRLRPQAPKKSLEAPTTEATRLVSGEKFACRGIPRRADHLRRAEGPRCEGFGPANGDHDAS